MINTWNESLLHEELKTYFRGETGQIEVPLAGSICDVVTPDGTVIEIQTANLGALSVKLKKILKTNPVTLVYPLAKNTLVETRSAEGKISRRKSPKHGSIYQLFKELTGLVTLLGHESLTLCVLDVDILDIRVADGTGTWKNKGIRKEDKKMLAMRESRFFRTLADYATLIPETVPDLFTVQDLKLAGAGIHAGRMAWVLRKCGCIAQEGKRGNAYLYRRQAIASGSDISSRVPCPSFEVTKTVPE